MVPNQNSLSNLVTEWKNRAGSPFLLPMPEGADRKEGERLFTRDEETGLGEMDSHWERIGLV